MSNDEYQHQTTWNNKQQMKKETMIPIKHEDLRVGMEVTQIGMVGTKKNPKLGSRKYIITEEDINSPGIYYLDSRRTRTISKIFYDREIIAKLSDGSLYLKMGVKRKHYGDDLNYDDMHQIIEEERAVQPLITLKNI